MLIAEGRSAGKLTFSQPVPHGARQNNLGTMMMTRIETGREIFVHASDIQLLVDATVDQVIDWQPDIILAAGPPLYLHRLSTTAREKAWCNAMRLARKIDIVILDHHLMRSNEGAVWLDKLSTATNKKVYCAADYMNQSRRLLEAERKQLYQQMPVPTGWYEAYAKGKACPAQYINKLRYHATVF